MRVTTLGWGVKESFRRYVEMSGGEASTAGGAAQAADGTFTFAATADSDLAVDGDALSGTGRFAGTVGFKAHGGMLSVRLADPWVEAVDGGWVLSVAETATRRTAIAKLAPADGGTLEAVITLDGMQLIGDHYPPGTPLDPVRLGPAS